MDRRYTQNRSYVKVILASALSCAQPPLVTWVDLFGVDLEVVGPAELRDAAAQLARLYTTAVAAGCGYFGTWNQPAN